MAQTDLGRRLSLALLAKDWAERKGQSVSHSAPVFGLVPALRLLSSRAVSSARVPRVYHISQSTLGKGDISILQKRGHFYFGLTVR
jgi:hypothetical protein